MRNKDRELNWSLRSKRDDRPIATPLHRSHRSPDLIGEQWKPIAHLLVRDWPEDYTRIYRVWERDNSEEGVSEFLHLIAFLESCVNRLAAIYVHAPGEISWAVVNDERYTEVCREYGFDEDAFERAR